MFHFNITSEIGQLTKVLIHSPDNGLGKVVPSKAQDWLFEDIVHLDTIRREEYDHYIKLLMYFLDPKKIKGRLKEIDAPESNRVFYQPNHIDFHRSEHVIELQWLLAEVLSDKLLCSQIIASVCAIEGCTHSTQELLQTYTPSELASCLLSGTGNDKSVLFAPIPNFIFTRDIGIVIKDHIVLNKPAKIARHREALLAKYIFFYHPIFSGSRDNIIELHQNRPAFLIPDSHSESIITLEGGDVMMISEDHLIIGISERTSAAAAAQLAEKVFEKNLVSKVSMVSIPHKRDYMHIDTIFTQVKKNVWVMMGLFSEQMNSQHNSVSIEKFLISKSEDQVSVMQFAKSELTEPKYFTSLEALLRDISKHDFGCDDVQIIFSGNNEYPYSAREQWTDSCNLLALKEGVVLSYDRNEKTNAAFEQAGFLLVRVQDLIEDLEGDRISADDIKDTVILMPSAELSRARGGFHCMSMPLNRSQLLS
jgi:arginine deiminase